MIHTVDQGIILSYLGEKIIKINTDIGRDLIVIVKTKIISINVQPIIRIIKDIGIIRGKGNILLQAVIVLPDHQHQNQNQDPHLENIISSKQESTWEKGIKL